jgi:hypothetical protein
MTRGRQASQMTPDVPDASARLDGPVCADPACQVNGESSDRPERHSRRWGRGSPGRSGGPPRRSPGRRGPMLHHMVDADPLTGGAAPSQRMPASWSQAKPMQDATNLLRAELDRVCRQGPYGSLDELRSGVCRFVQAARALGIPRHRVMEGLEWFVGEAELTRLPDAWPSIVALRVARWGIEACFDLTPTSTPAQRPHRDASPRARRPGDVEAKP